MILFRVILNILKSIVVVIDWSEYDWGGSCWVGEGLEDAEVVSLLLGSEEGVETDDGGAGDFETPFGEESDHVVIGKVDRFAWIKINNL